MTYEEFLKTYRFDPNEDLINEGGFGKIYQAWGEHDREVIIKACPVKKNKYTLGREFEIAQKVQGHTHIAYYEQVFSFEVPLVGTMEYGIMQFYPDGDLGRVLKNHKLTLKEKHEILDGILKGIKHLHDNNVLHRDMKPGNILMQKVRGKWTAKITDFGIGKAFDAADNSISNTSSGIVSLLYASPEQILGKKTFPNTDLWPVGIIVHLIFAGETLFKSNESKDTEAYRADITRQITKGILPDTLSKIPEPFRSIARRCLIVDPQKRVQKADELLEILSSSIPTDQKQDVKELIIESEISDKTIIEEPEKEIDYELEDYNSALKSNTLDSLAAFLKKYPVSDRCEEIETRVEKLHWENAKITATKNSINQYLNKYGNAAKFNSEANKILKRLEAQEIEKAFNIAKKQNDKNVLLKFIENYPNSEYEQQALDEVEKLEWVETEQANNEQTTEQYIQKYDRKGKYTAKAEQKLENLIQKRIAEEKKKVKDEFDGLLAKKDIKGLERFINKFPDSDLVQLASDNIENIEWEEAKTNDSNPIYEKYISKFGKDAKYYNDALKAIKSNNDKWITLQYEEAIASKNVNKIVQFISDYNKSSHTESAKKEIEKLEWEDAKNSSSIRKLEVFIEKYPNSNFIEDAKNILEKTYWENSLSLNNINTFEKFKTRFPNSKRLRDADTEIKKIEAENIAKEEKFWAKTQKESSLSSYNLYLRKYPNGIYKKDALVKKAAFIKKRKKKTRNVFIVVSIIAVIILVLSIVIPTEEDYWNNAKKSNTIEAYEEYLNKYPDAEWENDAIDNIYSIAKEEASIELYEELLPEYSDSDAERHYKKLLRIEEKKRIAELEEKYEQLIAEGNSIFSDSKSKYNSYNYNAICTSVDLMKEAKGKYKKAGNLDIPNHEHGVKIKEIDKYANALIQEQNNNKYLVRNFPSEVAAHNRNINKLQEVIDN